MMHKKLQTKPKKTKESDQAPNGKIEPLITEAEDKHIEEEGDPLGANFA